MMKPELTDDELRERMGVVLNQMRECVLASHEQESHAATATLLFSCADALGPIVDPGISARSREAIGTLFVKQMNEFDEIVAEESRDKILLDLLNECSRERVGAFFKKQMNGFNEEVAAEDHDKVIAELHESYLAGFDRCFFPDHADSSYVEPVAWLPDGTEVPTVVNLERLTQDFLTAIEAVKCRLQRESEALSRVRQCLDSESLPGCVEEGE